MSITALTPQVEKALKDVPEYRDSDTRLVAYLIWKAVQKHGVYSKEELSAIHRFLSFYAKKKYPHPPTIKRVRAKLQEENPELRGEKYYERKHTQAPAVQQELGYGNVYKDKRL